MNQNTLFDPQLFLSLELDQKDQGAFSQKIMEQLSEYLTIRLIELLPEKDLEDIDSPVSFFSLAKEKIPNLEEKVKEFLNNFKDEINIHE